MSNVRDEGLGIQATLDSPFDEVIGMVTEAFKEQGFGVLTEINVQQTLKDKIGVEFTRYTILGACNPNLAHQALSAHPEVGLLLPCNVIVYEQGGRVVVSAMNPEKALGMVEAEGVAPHASAATRKIRTAMEKVAAG